ncbi:hypothetical protein JD844_031276 [Phrynosoma platyrhinos]|uniref:Saposin B-type domain-containing protein n=1 Tax=Phrynosoma platyrhinos TaxID=52577 RepID=A0ABQ7T0U6_PHRPL|nr:hypothetical protein JD844_031276 [Phrynosoma platyrhinos]
MVSLLLVLYLNIAVGSVLAGSDLDHPEACLQGPEFWCKDVATAAKCKKENYCWIYEWSSPLEEFIDEDTAPAPLIKCALCTKIVQKIKDMVGDDPDEAKIEEMIHKVCNVLSRFLRGTCKNFLRLFKRKLLKYLQKGMGTREICVAIQICKTGLTAYPGLSCDAATE